MMRLLSILLLSCLTVTNSYATCDSSGAGDFQDRFVINPDGTVTDKMTQLMWSRCDAGNVWDPQAKKCVLFTSPGVGLKLKTKLSWIEALNEVSEVNTPTSVRRISIYSDWRLPNIKEIASIIQRHCKTRDANLMIDESIFLGPDGNYWSSTPTNQYTAHFIRYKTDASGNYVLDPPVTGKKIPEYDYESAAWGANFKLGRVERWALSDESSVRFVRSLPQQ